MICLLVPALTHRIPEDGDGQGQCSARSAPSWTGWMVFEPHCSLLMGWSQEAQPAIVLTPRRNITRGRWETDRSVSAEVLLSVLLVGLFFGREVYDIKLAIAVPVIPSILMQTKVHTFLEAFM